MHEEALARLVQLVARGAEFPDAQWLISVEFKLNPTELAEVTAEYDSRT